MSVLSKLGLTLFEIINEIHMTFGAGIFGLSILIQQSYSTNQLLRTLSVVSLTVGSLVYVCRNNSEYFTITDNRNQPSNQQIVLITGCDSGLGYSLACHTCEMGFTVFAGFLNLQSPGALDIRNKYKLVQVYLDLTKSETIAAVVAKLQQYLQNDYELCAVVNNAGVMVFGEFEWLTDNLIMKQIEVNLIGTIRFSKACIPLLRKSNGRLINITSHCAAACLPGLSVYGATKSAIAAFSDGLRVEQAKYGVKIIQMIPGSFLQQSNILINHSQNASEMIKNFTQEQHEFYDDYFERYNEYLSKIPIQSDLQKLIDDKLYGNFEDALLSNSPKAVYKTEPLRYKLYHILFKLSPTCLRDYFVEQFVQMPQYYTKIKS